MLKRFFIFPAFFDCLFSFYLAPSNYYPGRYFSSAPSSSFPISLPSPFYHSFSPSLPRNYYSPNTIISQADYLKLYNPQFLYDSYDRGYLFQTISQPLVGRSFKQYQVFDYTTPQSVEIFPKFISEMKMASTTKINEISTTTESQKPTKSTGKPGKLKANLETTKKITKQPRVKTTTKKPLLPRIVPKFPLIIPTQNILRVSSNRPICIHCGK
ncbi:unnamed protein product, partial [Mesorhabditis belari]|uniref:Uncharacterized protein n=1 Tax=Mesorhabditis belari TaxID=2138241 RepID=A0AAF3F0R7_9BILA